MSTVSNTGALPTAANQIVPTGVIEDPNADYDPGYSVGRPPRNIPTTANNVESHTDTIFTTFDANGDGKINIESDKLLDKMYHAWCLDRWSRSETSRDTGLYQYDMAELARVADLAGNQDGYVTRVEVTKVLNQYDTDKNDKLSSSELSLFNNDMGPTKDLNWNIKWKLKAGDYAMKYSGFDASKKMPAYLGENHFLLKYTTELAWRKDFSGYPMKIDAIDGAGDVRSAPNAGTPTTADSSTAKDTT